MDQKAGKGLAVWGEHTTYVSERVAMKGHTGNAVTGKELKQVRAFGSSSHV